MRYDELVREVAQREGLPHANQAVRRDMRVVLYALGGLLPRDLRAQLARLLPEPADVALLQAPSDPVPELVAVDELYRRTARRLDSPLGQALERAQVVCLVLAQWMDRATRDRLLDVFGARGGDLFVERPITRVSSGGTGRTIADGRPGSAHPISEAAPHQRSPSHRHSIASTDNPHAATKLSSGGKPDDIARGRPS